MTRATKIFRTYNRVQRKHSASKIQRKEIEPNNFVSAKLFRLVQTSNRNKTNHTSKSSYAPANFNSALNSTKGSGSKLSESTQSFMESRFGHDFSNVKIHTDSNAVQMSKDVNAQAFTHGSDIYFNSGKYNPDYSSGKHLLAHELTHVVQQDSKVISKKIQRKLHDGHDLTNPRFAGDLVLEGCYDNERVLTVGSKGEAVRKVQQALVYAGFPLPIYHDDGIFGSETETAVLNFQKASSISDDGIVGPQTMGSLDVLRAPVPTPPSPAPPSKICGPDVSSETARIWSQIQSDFASWSFLQKHSACRYLVQPITDKGGLNIDAFDTLGLFQATTGWLRKLPYHPPCGVPGSTAPPGARWDHKGYIDPNTCSSTVKAGSGCWLSGTVNYGTFGIMMKLCSDWASILGISSPLFSPEMMRLLIYLYKEHYRSDDSGPPISWALASYNGGAGATASGGDRPNCQSSCPVTFSGPTFDYVWLPAYPRKSPKPWQ